MRLAPFFSTLLVCISMIGCGSRVLTDKDVSGTYKASADWGSSTLVLYPDHSFDQTVMRNDYTQTKTRGTWRLDLWAGKNASHGILVMKQFLAIDHNHKGEIAGWAAPGINRGLLWGITIAADPDYGISFDKSN